ncbi:spore coat protein YlbD [Sporolactobacillus nakayamae]|uniref:Putative coat protein n=1 Tax=Sporolactobacillus nakayamae TaxID=269670 RepID=A0A1I2RJV9_9BACL|nr:spore coat protein YlbD [Sporolactobacillus nakayamae]SFG38907.1 Putative coat protein [Sporolactobacillus nakayamae]
MTEEKTSAAIKRFKVFLRSHPEIVEYVHENGIRWNDVFDDWVIFGESHDVWEKYGIKETNQDTTEKSKKSSSFSFNKVLNVVDNIDTKQWQERLETISGALTGIQSFIGQFRQNNDQSTQNNPDTQNRTEQSSPTQPIGGPRNQNPFFFRRD